MKKLTQRLINTAIIISLPITLCTFAGATAAQQSSLESIEGTIPTSSLAVSKTLTNLFANEDSMYPNISSTAAQNIDPEISTRNLVSQWTQQSINQQLATMPYQISNAFYKLSDGTKSIKNPLQDARKILTLKSPSYDTLFLPELVQCSTSSCNHRAAEAILKQNASNLNFNSLIGPSSYRKTKDIDQQAAAGNYIKYSLETYQPMIYNNSSDTEQESFLQTLNDQLKTNAKNGGKEANKLLTKVLNSQKFQDYWLNLRTIQAQNSLLLSNFNYLAAERTPQTGLGTAYGLKTKDASTMQVESTLVNKSVYNPKWYQAMRTASPATLQREQLLLTATQVRLEYENKLINERNLATMSLMVHSLMQTNKEKVSISDAELKSSLFPKQADAQNKEAQSKMNKEYGNKGKMNQLKNGYKPPKKINDKE